jgi:hypothetical protein
MNNPAIFASFAALRETPLVPSATAVPMSLMLLWANTRDDKLKGLPSFKDASADFIVGQPAKIAKILCPEIAEDVAKIIERLPPSAVEIFRRVLLTALDRERSPLPVSGPWIVEAGIMGTPGLYITLADGQRGPIRKGQVVCRGLIKDKSAAEVTAFLLKFFAMVFDATGYPRPARLNGFP